MTRNSRFLLASYLVWLIQMKWQPIIYLLPSHAGPSRATTAACSQNRCRRYYWICIYSSDCLLHKWFICAVDISTLLWPQRSTLKSALNCILCTEHHSLNRSFRTCVLLLIDCIDHCSPQDGVQRFWHNLQIMSLYYFSVRKLTWVHVPPIVAKSGIALLAPCLCWVPPLCRKLYVPINTHE